MSSKIEKQEKDITDLLPSNLVSEMEINISNEQKEIESYSNEKEEYIDVNSYLFIVLNRNFLII